jgi:tRNA(fMet)-specific endonuclease VapC
MTLYIFDTDHPSLYGRNLPILVTKINQSSVVLTTTAVSAEEQFRGRLAQIAGAKDDAARSRCYMWLTETIAFLSRFQILQFTEHAQAIFASFQGLRSQIGKQDLRIAAITIAHGGILLTRNRRDFDRIPGLVIEDWSM